MNDLCFFGPQDRDALIKLARISICPMRLPKRVQHCCMMVMISYDALKV